MKYSDATSVWGMKKLEFKFIYLILIFFNHESTNYIFAISWKNLHCLI